MPRYAKSISHGKYHELEDDVHRAKCGLPDHFLGPMSVINPPLDDKAICPVCIRARRKGVDQKRQDKLARKGQG